MSDTTGRPLVLVVDDDPVNRTLARGVLEPEGFRVEEAVDGRAALVAFAAHGADLVLLDVMMPDLDGFEVCTALRMRPDGGTVPVLMLTGLNDLVSVSRAYEVGATDFSTKPVIWPLLPHRVRYLLRATRTLAELHESEARLATAQRIACLGYWSMELGQGALIWSEMTHRIFGTSPGEFTPTHQGFLSFVHPADRGAVERAAASVVETGRYAIGYRIVRADGRVRHLEEQGEVVLDDAGRPLRVEGIVHDVTERRKAEEEVLFLSRHDTLTRLPTRETLLEWLAQACARARRQGTNVAVCAIALHNLRSVNDTAGHAAGDQLLVAAAARLRDLLRVTDLLAREGPGQGLCEEDAGGESQEAIIARLSGGEFIVAAADLARVDRSVYLVERLVSRLAEPFRLEGREVSLGATCGVSVFPQDGREAEELLTNAAAALHHARRSSPGHFAYFSPSINDAAHRRLLIETGLRSALKRSELRLHYQPLVDASRAVVGFEALARWQHPELGPLSPAEFIPVAEESGLIHALGEWVIGQACRDAVRLRWAEPDSIVVSVNVSVEQLRKPGISAVVEEALRETGLPSRSLCLEITESALMDESSPALAELETLRKSGVRIAIDDFGTGYSSLAYLARVPVDTLKIDRSFVRDLPGSAHAATIVTAILAMARGLGLSTTAEGVETEEQAAHLLGGGCDRMQGYLFGRPGPQGTDA